MSEVLHLRKKDARARQDRGTVRRSIGGLKKALGLGSGGSVGGNSEAEMWRVGWA